jgi:hypothetical protein
MANREQREERDRKVAGTRYPKDQSPVTYFL